MSALALKGLSIAMRRLSDAIDGVESYCAQDGQANVSPGLGEAFANLLVTRGELAAAMQLLELERDLERADTERPSSLRLVK